MDMHENPIIKHSKVQKLYFKTLDFYFRVFMHIDARDETLSQVFCFMIGYTVYRTPRTFFWFSFLIGSHVFKIIFMSGLIILIANALS